VSEPAPHRDVFLAAADGVVLHARDHGPPDATLTPVLCLPGLTRNAKDFEAVAARLARRRRVVSPDFRGRGQSAYAADPLTYRPDVELADTLHLLDHLGIGRVAVIGTSRGGLVAMLLAASAPQRLAGVLFNDIGPRIDAAGLLRIRSYLGSDPRFDSWAAAVAALRATNPGIAGLSDGQWLIFARRVFREVDGLPRADYDPRLAATFPSAEDIAAGNIPELWGLLDQLPPVPATVLRGENSDLLSAATVAEMKAHVPHLKTVTVKDRGHVPFLDEPESLSAIDAWLAQVDEQEGSSRPARPMPSRGTLSA